MSKNDAYIHTELILSVEGRDETILQYIDILQYLLLQHNTIRLKKILHIAIFYCAIYCKVCCFNVVNIQLLHHKNDWTSGNLAYILQFLTTCMVVQDVCIFFSLLLT